MSGLSIGEKTVLHSVCDGLNPVRGQRVKSTPEVVCAESGRLSHVEGKRGEWRRKPMNEEPRVGIHELIAGFVTRKTHRNVRRCFRFTAKEGRAEARMAV